VLDLCPRLVSSIPGCSENFPSVDMAVHTRPHLPLLPLMPLEEFLSHRCPSGKEMQAESAWRPQCTKVGPRRGCQGLQPRSTQAIPPRGCLRKYSQRWMETIGCHLATFVWGQDQKLEFVYSLNGEEALCRRVDLCKLPPYRHWCCSGIRLALGPPIVGSG
jgi:hypothetical protein